MRKLTICIPTYNRSDLAISQLKFLENEIIPYNDSIVIIVADNYSLIEHRDKLIDYHSKNNFFELKLNQSNLGSIGNIYYLLDCVNSENVWFVSDDDVLLTGVIARVFDILTKNKELLYIYLNHSAFSKSSDVIDYTPNMLTYSGYYPEGKQCVMDLFKENGTVNMFITSCIYAAEPLKGYCAERNKQTLIDPLLFSFKLALGPTYIESEVFILERCVGFSWVDEALAIFSWQVQDGLIELLDHEYSVSELKELIFSFYASRKANYTRMLLQAPKHYKVEIVSLLGFSQIKLFLPSLFFNIKRFYIKAKNRFSIEFRETVRK
ncbi:MAG: glycosyltransferase family A protein [Paludibacter sp.]|nr:glycosyltransferase family A protein [Paludibacter sp.]